MRPRRCSNDVFAGPRSALLASSRSSSVETDQHASVEAARCRGCARRLGSPPRRDGRLRPASRSREETRHGDRPDRPHPLHARRGPHPAGLVQHRRRPAEPAAAAAPPGHRPADRPRRPRAALPDGADQAGRQPGPRDRDPGSRPRRLQALSAEAAPSRAAAGEGARYARPHLLQVRGRQPVGQPQAEHRARPGVLQQGRGRDPPRDRDRRRPVGERAGVRRRRVRARGQGLHGPRELRPEAVPPDPDGDLRRAGRRQPVADTSTAGRSSPRHRATRGRSGSRSARRSRTPSPIRGRSTRSGRCSTSSCSTRR